jgi:uncharacterized protein (DUF1697 family)
VRYVCWLHAVNLGSHNKVPMSWLRDAVTEAGFADVSTYLQSGNLVLTSSASAARVRDRVIGLLHDGLGLDIEVTVRSRAEIATVIARNPMPEHTDEPAKLQVSFLTGKPDPKGVAGVDPDAFVPDRFVVQGTEIYLWLPNGAGRSKLATFSWQKRIGVAGTARNWRTVLAVHDLLAG